VEQHYISRATVLYTTPDHFARGWPVNDSMRRPLRSLARCRDAWMKAAAARTGVVVVRSAQGRSYGRFLL